jgi:hypothetical protein
MPNIVTVNVSQLIAPTPSTLQQTGALISQGGTNTAPGTISLLTGLGSLTPILNGAKAITSISWGSNLATVTTSAPHGFTIGDTLLMTIASASPVGYNGTFTATVTQPSVFTYPLAINPGGSSVTGTYSLEDIAELNAMATTFFAQGSQTPVYVFELGPGNPADGVIYLNNWITNNPQFFYSYLVPRGWANEPTFISMIASYEAPTKLTYFFVTPTLSNYTSFTPLMKDVVAQIEAPGIPSTEFSLASDFWVSLHYEPSTTNKVTPYAFSYLFGVTSYPTLNNGALMATLKTAAVNVVGTGASGGISENLIQWGTTMDGNDFTYWYSVDWHQINIALDVNNEIINGSNNPVNPLYYNQAGIDRLQARISRVVNRGVTFGLGLFTPIQTSLDGPDLNDVIDSLSAIGATTINSGNNPYLGKAIVNAVPFITYRIENPSDYKIGRYAGFSIIYTPSRGFTNVIINLVVSQFVVP